METLRGKMSLELNRADLCQRVAAYQQVWLDLGTGDGRFVRYMAEHHPEYFVMGLDACRENLRTVSALRQPNMLFVIARAQALPPELYGMANQITINFPWGSLLESLLAGDPALMGGLAAAARPDAAIEIRLNGGALAEAGFGLEAGVAQVGASLRRWGWRVWPPAWLDAGALRGFNSTWAKRLAFGRDPRAVSLRVLHQGVAR